MMLPDKILTNFQKNPRLRVLFFFDKEGAYQDEIRQMQLPNVRVIAFDGRWLYWKIELNREQQEKTFFYIRQDTPDTQEELLRFPLLDLLKANKELRLDDIAEFMDDYGLQPHQQPLVSRYKEELTKTPVLQVLQPVLNAANFDEKTVKQGLLSAFFDFNKIEDSTMLLIRLLSYADPEKQKRLNNLFTRLRKNNLLDTLNQYIRQAFNTTIEGLRSDEITGLVRRLKYNAITQNLHASPADAYKELKITEAMCITYLNQLLETGLKHATLSKAFKETLRRQGVSINVDKIVATYGYDAAYEYLPDDLVWAIIQALVEQPSGQTNACLKALYLRITEEGNIQSVLTFLYHVSVVNMLIKEAGNMTCDTPEDCIERYVGVWHKIDFSYRKAVVAYWQIDFLHTPVEAQLNNIKQALEKAYFEFGYRLNDGWLKSLHGIGFDYKRIGCDKQFDFYANHIRPLQQKRAIIISDALRYEVATELVGELHKDDKNVSTLYYQLASIPSKTNVGMANLLPGETCSYEVDCISIDGDKTSTVEQREKVLRKYSPMSKSVHYETIIENDKQQNRALFKADVVYVYHNVIDKEGHHGTERNTFKAVRTAIEELSKLVKLILGGFGVSKVFVTSDHGFLYNDMEIAEADKNEIRDTEIIYSGVRHYITCNHHPVAFGYKMPLFMTSPYQEPYYVVIPDAINRFKKKGSRYRYAHGGGSLQELVVPVIESARKEERIPHKVVPALVDKNLTIVSNSFRFQLLQQTAISATEKECTVLIGLYDNEQLVSLEKRLRLDATSELPTDRVYTVQLALTARATKSVLKLKVVDEDDRYITYIEENVKNNTLVARDF